MLLTLLKNSLTIWETKHLICTNEFENISVAYENVYSMNKDQRQICGGINWYFACQLLLFNEIILLNERENWNKKIGKRKLNSI